MNRSTIKSIITSGFPYALTLYSIALVSFVSIVSIAQTPQAGSQSDLTSRVDQIFTRWDRPDSPGCILGVIKDGKLIYKKGYGMANLEYDIPITPATVFHIGSASNQFTAMSILLLAKQEKLSLDDDIRKYLTELPAYQAAITIRQLIYHTSGVRDRIDLLTLAGRDFNQVYREDDIIELLARQKDLNFKPGARQILSSSDYVLLAAIIKKVSGRSLRQFANENIFNPLGMTNTGFQDEDVMIIKNRASEYISNNEGGFQLKPSNVRPAGDGGLYTTVEDLLLWDQNFYQNKLGEPELINQFLIPGTLNDGEKINYASGLTIDKYKGLRTISIGGAFQGNIAELLQFPDQKFTVICLFNFDRFPPNFIARQVADIYLADEFKKQVAEGGKSGEVKSIQMSEKEFKDKTGTYLDPVNRRFWTLEIEEGKLAVSATNGMRFRIRPVSATEFREFEVPVRIDVRFENRSEGERPMMHLAINQQKPSVFEPVKLVTPTSTELADYVGEYYSDDLQATYRVAVETDKLVVTARHQPKFVLSPAIKDEFQFRNYDFEFTRDGQNKVNGFLLDTGPSINIRFVRSR
jgi:CubicO group peptidase (beta-lactamase class C family)